MLWALSLKQCPRTSTLKSRTVFAMTCEDYVNVLSAITPREIYPPSSTWAQVWAQAWEARHCWQDYLCLITLQRGKNNRSELVKRRRRVGESMMHSPPLDTIHCDISLFNHLVFSMLRERGCHSSLSVKRGNGCQFCTLRRAKKRQRKLNTHNNRGRRYEKGSVVRHHDFSSLWFILVDLVRLE